MEFIREFFIWEGILFHFFKIWFYTLYGSNLSGSDLALELIYEVFLIRYFNFGFDLRFLYFILWIHNLEKQFTYVSFFERSDFPSVFFNYVIFTYLLINASLRFIFSYSVEIGFFPTFYYFYNVEFTIFNYLVISFIYIFAIFVPLIGLFLLLTFLTFLVFLGWPTFVFDFFLGFLLEFVRAVWLHLSFSFFMNYERPLMADEFKFFVPLLLFVTDFLLSSFF